MGIAERVLVFVILCNAHAVLAELNDQLENDDLSNLDFVNLNSGRSDDQDLDESNGDNSGSLRNGDAADGQEDAALGNSGNTISPAGMVAPALPSCNGWQVIGQASPCQGGVGSCVTVCFDCQSSQPNYNYIPGPGATYEQGGFGPAWVSTNQQPNQNVSPITYQPGSYNTQPLQQQPLVNTVVQPQTIMPPQYPKGVPVYEIGQHQTQEQRVFQPQGYPSVVVPGLNPYAQNGQTQIQGQNGQNGQHQHQHQTQENAGYIIQPQGYPSGLVPGNQFVPAQGGQFQVQEQIQTQNQGQNSINPGFGSNAQIIGQPQVYPSAPVPGNLFVPAQGGQYQGQEQMNSGQVQSQVQTQTNSGNGQNGQMQSQTQGQDQSNGFLNLLPNNVFGFVPNVYLNPSRKEQKQMQTSGGGSQTQTQLQVGRNGLPLSDEKHSVRNNIRLRIYA